MATVNYSNQLKYTGKGYIDAIMQPVATYDDLKSIPTKSRFVGLEVVVLNDETHDNKQMKYWLKGGILNGNWTPMESESLMVTGNDTEAV